MTGTMDEKEGQTTSIHVKQNDARVARRYGYEKSNVPIGVYAVRIQPVDGDSQ